MRTVREVSVRSAIRTQQKNREFQRNMSEPNTLKTSVKERPILFSGPMVRAILDGRKTQTRRIVNPQPSAETKAWWSCVSSSEKSFVGKWTPRDSKHVKSNPKATGASVRCPYGDFGDRLWVRESMRGIIDTKCHADESMPVSAYVADGAHSWSGSYRTPWQYSRTAMPSIHMPRRLSRITLEITRVSVERLNEISESDAIAEGIESEQHRFLGMHFKCYGELERLNQWTVNPKWSYETLWESINGSDSWAVNPWVWVIEFKRVASAI